MMVLPGTVEIGGEITAYGRRYWSPNLAECIGFRVEVHHDLADDPVFASVWSRGRSHRYCTVALIGPAEPIALGPSHAEVSASERQRLIGLVSRHNDERASQAANADHLPKDAGKPRKFLSVLAVLLAAQILRHLFHKQHGAARRAHSRLVGE